MKNNFTDFVRESVIGKWLNLQINTPKKYLLNFNIDDFYYKDLFRSKLDLLVRKISKENFKYYNKNIMVGISGLYYWKMLDWDMQEKLDMI